MDKSKEVVHKGCIFQIGCLYQLPDGEFVILVGVHKRGLKVHLLDLPLQEFVVESLFEAQAVSVEPFYIQGLPSTTSEVVTRVMEEVFYSGVDISVDLGSRPPFNNITGKFFGVGEDGYFKVLNSASGFSNTSKKATHILIDDLECWMRWGQL